MAIQTIARLYDSYDDALETVRDLEAAEVPHDDISLMANNAGNHYVPKTGDTGNDAAPGAEIGAGVGAIAGGGVGVLAGLGMLAIPGIGPVVAAGWLVALALGAAGGAVAGGLFGGLIGAGISKEHAEIFVEGVRRGGTLVTVRISGEHAPPVEAIMDWRAVDPEARRADYAASGWSGFEPGAPDLSPEEAARERAA